MQFTKLSALLESKIKSEAVLTIGNRVKGKKFPSAAKAIEYFDRVRDASGEGASTFDNGELTVNGVTYKISYNGRVWAKGDDKNPIDLKSL